MKKVFCAAPAGQLRNAYVGDRNQTNRFYARGFVEAADALVDIALTKNPALNDQFFSPVCFLYRHASELALKGLIQQAENVINLRGHAGDACNPRNLAEVEKELANTHSLECLLRWLDKRLRDLIGQVLPADVRNAILELHSRDPNGQTFRYANTKNGERHKKFQKTPIVDLGRIRDHLGVAVRFLLEEVGKQLKREEQSCLVRLCPQP